MRIYLFFLILLIFNISVLFSEENITVFSSTDVSTSFVDDFNQAVSMIDQSINDFNISDTDIHISRPLLIKKLKLFMHDYIHNYIRLEKTFNKVYEIYGSKYFTIYNSCKIRYAESMLLAVYLSGEYRISECVTYLVSHHNIRHPNSFIGPSSAGSVEKSIYEIYPAALALIKIGKPASRYCLGYLLDPDSILAYKLDLIDVIICIEGKDYWKYTLELELSKAKTERERERIKILADYYIGNENINKNQYDKYDYRNIKKRKSSGKSLIPTVSETENTDSANEGEKDGENEEQ